MQFTVMKLVHAVTQVQIVSFFAARFQTLKQNLVIDVLSQPISAHFFQCFAE